MITNMREDEFKKEETINNSTISELLLQALDIRYVKLKFTLEMTEDAVLSEYKTSAIRGGIGEMLLRANCIHNRNCETCGFIDECIVQRTMYSRFEIQPDSVNEGESIGYILQCESKKRNFAKGDHLVFFLTLFGKTIVYFSQYINAIYALGVYGLGKNHAKFKIVRLQNSFGQDILLDTDILMERYKVRTVGDYVKYRLSQLNNHKDSWTMFFYSPVSLKYHGSLLTEFDMDALYRSMKRRIYMLDCFEGIKLDIRNLNPKEPTLLSQESRSCHIPRYSNRKNERIVLHGIVGEIEFESSDLDTIAFFLAGELLHIGKNSSFGFGRYMIQ